TPKEGGGYKESNYDITKNEGTLTVTASEKAVVITADSNHWTYDGQPHSDGGFTVTYDGSTIAANEEGRYVLPTGDELKVTVTGSVTDVDEGKVKNEVSYTLENQANYSSVQAIPGELYITERPVTLTSGS